MSTTRKELDLLIENYFTPSFETSDVLRLVEEVMEQHKLVEGRELGKPFEYVVVQVVREKSGGVPLSGGDYDKVPAWKEEVFGGKGGKTLEGLAIQLYEMASAAIHSNGKKMFSEEDFKTAKVTTIPKSIYGGTGGKVEIKTDIEFGDKLISLKLPGDVQAGSAEGGTQVTQLALVLDNYLARTEEYAKTEMYKIADEEAKLLHADLFQELSKDILTLAEQKFLGKRRLSDFKKGKAPEGLIEAYIEAGILDAALEIINKDYEFDTDKLTAPIREKIEQIFTPQSPLYKELVRELLSGAAGFEGIAGAAAMFILSPDHVFDLSDQDTIDIFSEAIVLRVALKGGRASGIPAIDIIKKDSAAKAAYRWDIKIDLLEKALLKRRAVAIRKRDALSKLHPTPERAENLREQETDIEQSIHDMFAAAYANVMTDVVNDFEKELKDAIG